MNKKLKPLSLYVLLLVPFLLSALMADTASVSLQTFSTDDTNSVLPGVGTLSFVEQKDESGGADYSSAYLLMSELTVSPTSDSRLSGNYQAYREDTQARVDFGQVMIEMSSGQVADADSASVSPIVGFVRRSGPWTESASTSHVLDAASGTLDFDGTTGSQSVNLSLNQGDTTYSAPLNLIVVDEDEVTVDRAFTLSGSENSSYAVTTESLQREGIRYGSVWEFAGTPLAVHILDRTDRDFDEIPALSETSEQPVAIWTETLNFESGWRYSDWFGWFNQVNMDVNDRIQGWMYHDKHGWVFVIGETESEMYFWDEGLGWVYIGSGDYPWLYRLGSESDAGWYFYDEATGSAGDGRWFFYQVDDTWSSI